MTIQIIVATHKDYWMPEDQVYLPLQVGAQGRDDLGFQRDNEGENISEKNANYCELTGLYWAWKNLKADYIGLVHYRRHFSKGIFGNRKKRILKKADYERLFQDAEIVLPHKRHYWIETNYSQYIHAHHEEDLKLTRKIIQEKYPDYIPAYDACMNKRSGHRFNMFVMKYQLMQEYCTWLFDILFALEQRLNILTYNANDRRVFGFVGERLLDVWLAANRMDYRESPYVFLENQHWLVKGTKFVKRKLRGGEGK